MLPARRATATDTRQRPAEEVSRAGVNPEIEQLEPVLYAPIGNQVIGIGGQTGARNQPPNAPQTAGLEPEQDNMAMCGEHAIDLSQDLVRSIAVVERVRQQYAIDRVIGDG